MFYKSYRTCSWQIFTVYPYGDGIQAGATVATLTAEKSTFPVLVGPGSFPLLRVELPEELHEEWQRQKVMHIDFAQIEQVMNEPPKLIVVDKSDVQDEILVVLCTKYSTQRGESYIDNGIGWVCSNCGITGTYPRPQICPVCNHNERPTGRAAKFPGTVVTRDTNVEWDRTHTEWKTYEEQLVAIIPKGIVFSTGYTSNCSRPLAEYYLWDGQQLKNLPTVA